MLLFALFWLVPDIVKKTNHNAASKTDNPFALNKLFDNQFIGGDKQNFSCA